MTVATPTLPIATPTAAESTRWSGSPRMRALCVLESTNQLYSGIGRNLFETARRLTDRIAWEFAIDDRVPKNVDLLVRFGADHGLPVHVGAGRFVGGQCGPVNDGLPGLLRSRRWDAVDLVGWANSASHAIVLDEVGDAVVCYTPHDQPTWTVEFSEAEAAHVAEVHRRVIRRADVVLCDSPAERRSLEAFAPDAANCQFVPLGCDFDAFRAGPPDRRPQLLFVGDLLERRKRFDRVVGVFERLHNRRPDLRLVVVGNRSDGVGGLIPGAIRPACDLRGYISEGELRRTYAESSGLFLLSDYEAFGLPIVEALASGTPVFLHRQDVMLSVFGEVPGAHFCPGDDLDATAAIVAETLASGPAAIAEVLDGRERLRSTFGWEPLADRKWQALATAWFHRHHWPWRG